MNEMHEVKCKTEKGVNSIAQLKTIDEKQSFNDTRQAGYQIVTPRSSGEKTRSDEGFRWQS